MDGIALAGQIMSMKQAQVQQTFSVGVLKMQMNQQAESAAAIIDMASSTGVSTMEKSVNPNLGQRLDVLG